MYFFAEAVSRTSKIEGKHVDPARIREIVGRAICRGKLNEVAIVARELE